MNCREFESLLADKLGNELSNDDRTEFESHVAACAACRAEFEAHRATLERLRRSVPGPTRATMKQEGGRVLITTHNDSGNREKAGLRFPGTLLRYAAVILFSFAAGYLARSIDVDPTSNPEHDTVLVESRDQSNATRPTGEKGGMESDSIRQAVLVAHRNNPTRSNAGKFIAAMFAKRH